MVEMTPAWKNPCCWESSGRNGSEISTRPASTFSRAAPRKAIAPWRAKLARARASKSGTEGCNLGQRKAVEVAGVGRGVGAGVLDEDEVAFLQVRGEELLAHHHVDRIAGRARHVPRHGLPVAVRIYVV